MEKEQMKWLNCAKTVAILAVITDHTASMLNTNRKVLLASYCSVSLFILISGMTSYISYSKNSAKGKIICKCKNLLFDYCIATFIYQICETHFFDLELYLSFLFRFSASRPFYFVLLYIQLTLVSGLLFNFLQRCSENKSKEYLYEIFGFIIIVVISWLTTNYTNILNVYGGGGDLLGGTYLILYYLGMIIMKHRIFSEISLRKSVLMMTGVGILWFVWWYFVICDHRTMVDGLFPFGDGINPPGICFMISAIFMLFFLFGIFTLLQRSKVTNWLVEFMNYFGKNTLNIFLYHLFFLDFILCKYVIIDNIWVKCITYFIVMIEGPVVLGMIKDKILKIILWINRGEKLN